MTSQEAKTLADILFDKASTPIQIADPRSHSLSGNAYNNRFK